MAGDIIDLGMRVDTRDMDQGKRKVRDFGDEVKKADKQTAASAANIRKQFLLIGAAVAAAAGALRSLGATINVIAGFEQSMAAVGAITRASTEDLTAMRDVAKELGATTEFTASQAADGLKFLGMAGFEAKEAIAAIPDVLNLATAAQMDLARAADITSNIMSAFGLSANQANKAADVLAAVASRANTDVEQLGDAMKYAGPVASALGISINDTAAALGVLSDNGLQGSMAGTGMRQVMAALVNPTGDAAAAIKSMGIALEDVNPATNDFVTVIERLAAGGLGENAAAALTIFGDRGGPAALALANSSARLRELTTAMEDVDGEAERMSSIMRDNLQGDINGLKSAIEGLMISVGEAGLTAALRSAVQWMTELIRAVSGAIDGISKLTSIVAEDVNNWIRLGEVVGFVNGIFTGFFKDALYGLELVAKATVWTADKFLDIWTGTVDGVIAAFKSIPEALEAIFVGVLNFLAQKFANFVNGIIEGINVLLAYAGKEAIGTIDAFQIQSDASLANVGAGIMEAVKGGMDRADLAGYVDGTLQEAFGTPDQSNQRAADQYLDFLNGRAAAGRTVTPNPNPVTGTGGGGGGGSSAPKEQIDERLEDAKRLFDETRTSAELYAAELTDINELLQMGYIDQDTYNRALKQLQEEYMGAGDAAKFFEGQMNAVKGGIVDAIVEGKSLIGVLADVAKSIAKAALQAALFGGGPMSGLFGQTPGTGILSFIPGFAGGTNSAPGGMALVGERGPELVNLPKGSQVIPSSQTMQMMNQKAPQVNQKIVNVLDPRLVGDYLNTVEGEELIMNVVSRNQQGT